MLCAPLFFLSIKLCMERSDLDGYWGPHIWIIYSKDLSFSFFYKEESKERKYPTLISGKDKRRSFLNFQVRSFFVTKILSLFTSISYMLNVFLFTNVGVWFGDFFTCLIYMEKGCCIVVFNRKITLLIENFALLLPWLNYLLLTFSYIPIDHLISLLL